MVFTHWLFMPRSFGLQVFDCRTSGAQSAKVNTQAIIGCGAVVAVQVVVLKSGQTDRDHAHNQLLKHRSGHFVASTGQPLLRSVCRLAKRYLA